MLLMEMVKDIMKRKKISFYKAGDYKVITH